MRLRLMVGSLKPLVPAAKLCPNLAVTAESSSLHKALTQP
jgi:hypothetical protein